MEKLIKYIFLIFLAILFSNVKICCQSLTAGIWIIESSRIIIDLDTVFLFKRNQNIDSNYYDFSKISYNFENSSTYSGTSSDSTMITGVWQIIGDTLQIDSNKSGFYFSSIASFYTRTKFSTFDINGQPLIGYSQINFINPILTRINDLTLKGTTINYDNTNNFVTINSTNSGQLVVIINQLGQLVLHETIGGYEHQINCSAFPQGIYVISVTDGKRVICKKIAKL